MTFITARDLRLKASEIWEKLKEEGEIVVTVNGRPCAIITGTTPEGLEESLTLLKRLRAQIAVARMRESAAKKGRVSSKVVEREIKTVRKGRA
jgi:antitoxin (DNA-binding transcriptional repressor) of toxin-antitoxin stability system